MINKRIGVFLFFIFLGIAVVSLGALEITDRTDLTTEQIETKATITELDFKDRTFKSGSVDEQFTRYEGVITYKYSIGENEYLDKKSIGLVGTNDSQELKEQVDSKYYEGNKIDIYVDGTSPKISYLNKRTSIVPHLLVVIGSIVSILTLVLANRGRKS